MKKILLIAVGIVLLAIGSFLSYLKFALPNVGDAEDITIEATEERLRRGEYLANNVAACISCHSTRNWNLIAAPLIPNTEGQGGEAFTQDIGLPGAYYARNITPYGIGDMTDGELLRAITAGVDRDGNALFPIMPHHSYGEMDREDIYSIIAYIRTLTPIVNDTPPSVSDFPMSLIINTIPKKAKFSKIPDRSNKVEYGGYLVKMASCNDCHTHTIKGKVVEGMEFAGGFDMPLPNGGTVRPSNITPDPVTGIGYWTEPTFIKIFKSYGDSSYRQIKVGKGEFNTWMPWTEYGNMTEEDLSAIYAYLRTLKPVKNLVERFTKN